jgi:hypothetical protein
LKSQMPAGMPATATEDPSFHGNHASRFPWHPLTRKIPSKRKGGHLRLSLFMMVKNAQHFPVNRLATEQIAESDDQQAYQA